MSTFVGQDRPAAKPSDREAVRSAVTGLLVLLGIVIAVTVGFSMANRDARHATPSIACQVEEGSAPGTLVTVCSDR
jgi:hypothetical protein